MEETVDLPEGTEVDLAIVDPGDDLDDGERQRLNASLRDAQAELDAGAAVPAAEALASVRGLGRR